MKALNVTCLFMQCIFCMNTWTQSTVQRRKFTFENKNVPFVLSKLSRITIVAMNKCWDVPNTVLYMYMVLLCTWFPPHCVDRNCHWFSHILKMNAGSIPKTLLNDKLIVGARLHKVGRPMQRYKTFASMTSKP